MNASTTPGPASVTQDPAPTSAHHDKAHAHACAADDERPPEAAWLSEFELLHGRPLRVLHVGNIANNAYLNAVFLRRVGIDVHVLCHDYYDSMATPEWESSRREQWFVQGPQFACITYLNALLDGHPVRTRLRMLQLQLLRRLITNPRSHALGARIKHLSRRLDLRTRLVLGWRAWRRRGTSRLGLHASRPQGEEDPKNAGTQLSAYEERCSWLVKRFREVFPERRDQLQKPDVVPWSNIGPWASLFARYDIVQCYATDPIRALLAGTRPYVAYEHGTLRDFTLGDDPIHRLNALAYTEADHVFITNGDCLEIAHKLGIGRFSPMIHPVDVDFHRKDFEQEAATIRSAIGCDVLLVCPLRHDWAIKGTDNHIRALPRIIEQTPGRVSLVLCEWGAELDASRQLTESLGVADHIVWRPPLDRARLVAHLKAADVVLDQLALPHFGATAPQALAAGSPVVMSYRPESTAWIVDEPAPILPAFDPAGVAAAVTTALDPEWRRQFAERARSWVERYHHPRRIVVEHCSIYSQILSRSE